MSKAIYKSKSIKISNECYDFLRENLSPMIKMSKFVESAIFDKIEREKKSEKVLYTQDFKPIV